MNQKSLVCKQINYTQKLGDPLYIDYILMNMPCPGMAYIPESLSMGEY